VCLRDRILDVSERALSGNDAGDSSVAEVGLWLPSSRAVPALALAPARPSVWRLIRRRRFSDNVRTRDPVRPFDCATAPSSASEVRCRRRDPLAVPDRLLFLPPPPPPPPPLLLLLLAPDRLALACRLWALPLP